MFQCTNCASGKVEIQGTIDVRPNISYALEVELLRTDLDAESENAEIFVDGESIGTCNPSGGQGDCTFFKCSQMNHGQNVPVKTVTSKSGVIHFQANYSSEVGSGSGLSCSVNGVEAAGFAVVTLTKGRLLPRNYSKVAESTNISYRKNKFSHIPYDYL